MKKLTELRETGFEEYMKASVMKSTHFISSQIVKIRNRLKNKPVDLAELGIFEHSTDKYLNYFPNQFETEYSRMAQVKFVGDSL